MILKGDIVSTNRMIKITASIFSDEILFIPPIEVSLNNQYKYSLQGSEINNLNFDTLDEGQYLLLLEIEYLSDNKQQICSKEIESIFTVTSKKTDE